MDKISDLKEIVINTLDLNKAQDIVTIDLKDKSSMADFMIIASGTSSRHIQSLSEQVLEKLKKNETRDLEKNGKFDFKKSIQLEKVSFKYLKNKKRSIIDDISLTIEKGNAVGLVGKSGSGKSTLINLICGLLTPSNGLIKIDERDISQNIANWQKKIGLVPQINYLLDDTILNNIVFLEETKNINKKKLENAMFYSGVSEFIDQLEKGLNTTVGERGSSLSGGQIQRIALARVLYQDPDVLILDELQIL